jgi:hypothetical protein
MPKGVEGQQLGNTGTTKNLSNLLTAKAENVYGGLEPVLQGRIHWTRHWLFLIALWSLITLNSTIYACAFRFLGFNNCAWNAFFVLVPLCTLAFLLAFRSVAYQKDGYYYFFDAKHNASSKLKNENGEFGPHSQRYNDIAKLLIALSAGIIAFLINTLANASGQQSEILKAMRSMAPIIVGFFGFSIALLILFMALQAYWYEEYCHSENHNSYNRWKYAICVTLGWTGLFSFGVGVIWLAANLF